MICLKHLGPESCYFPIQACSLPAYFLSFHGADCQEYPLFLAISIVPWLTWSHLAPFRWVLLPFPRVCPILPGSLLLGNLLQPQRRTMIFDCIQEFLQFVTTQNTDFHWKLENHFWNPIIFFSFLEDLKAGLGHYNGFVSSHFQSVNTMYNALPWLKGEYKDLFWDMSSLWKGSPVKFWKTMNSMCSNNSK